MLDMINTQLRRSNKVLTVEQHGLMYHLLKQEQEKLSKKILLIVDITNLNTRGLNQLSFVSDMTNMNKVKNKSHMMVVIHGKIQEKQLILLSKKILLIVVMTQHMNTVGLSLMDKLNVSDMINTQLRRSNSQAMVVQLGQM